MEGIIMKKVNIFFTAALVLVASCAKEEVPAVLDKNDAGQTTITFTADLETPTKTSLVEGKKVYWTEGDCISVFGDVALTNTSFSASEINNEKASFTGYVTDEATDAAYYAVYPYKESNKIEVKTDGETGAVTTILTTDIPYYQKAVKGGFDTDLNVMVAKTTPGEQHLSFKNVCSLIKFTIPESLTNVVSVGISSREILSGRVRMEFSEDGAYAMNSEGNNTNTTNYKEVTLASENGTALESGDYYVVVRPNTNTYSLFHITVTMTDGTVQAFKMKENKQAIMAENNIYNLGAIDMEKMKQFKITNAPVGDFPMGVATYQLTWEGEGTPTFSERTKDIATVDKNTGLVTFTGKIGKAIVGVNCDGVDYRVAFNITKGYYREEYDADSGSNPWLISNGWSNSSHKAKDPEFTAAGLKIYPLLSVKTDNKGTEDTSDDVSYNSYRCDMKKTCSEAYPAYMNIEYPIVCFCLEDVKDTYGVSRNITFDVVEKDGGIGGAVQSNNVDGKYKYLVDGKRILIYDLSEQTIGGKRLSDYGMIEFQKTFQLKYADINNSTKKTDFTADLSLNFYGYYTFRTLEEAKAYFGITD